MKRYVKADTSARKLHYSDLRYLEILDEYHMIDEERTNVNIFQLYEHNQEGDEAPCILVCLADDGHDFFCYTWESLEYTVQHLDDEYTLYEL